MPMFPEALPAPSNILGNRDVISEGHRCTAVLFLSLANGQFLSPAHILSA